MAAVTMLRQRIILTSTGQLLTFHSYLATLFMHLNILNALKLALEVMIQLFNANNHHSTTHPLTGKTVFTTTQCQVVVIPTQKPSHTTLH
jgi:hypothetical protein